MNQQQNISNLIQMRQNKFIETRTIIETEVNKFFKSIDSLDDDAKTRLGVKIFDNACAKQILPSLWKEPFDEEKYKQELANLNAYIGKVQDACNVINQEAITCLQSLP